ncbi:four-carbon acid sugar kinase family protein [Solibacillus sp. FSL K6-1781]|uniref:four-carbon acid sugar kinase family protein n=1 Tax=Solibacillus sp. FSL K6-1781 TaxID=2921474 RepID=UPI00315A0BE6
MKIGIIADDLTGANATGVKLSKQGFSATTLTSFQTPPTLGAFNAVCVDTDSRYVQPDLAKARVQAALQNFQNWEADLICKRIDSTVRGNIGYEVDTILEALGEESIAIVVASFPESGRITSGGYLLVNGVPLQTTDVAKDPVNPLKKSFVPHIIQKQSKFPVVHIGLETVLLEVQQLTDAINKEISNGNRIIVLDAVTDDDIDCITAAMLKVNDYTLVPVDPGPLTAKYSKAILNQQSQNKKIVASIGSITPTASKQIQYLLEKTDAYPYYIDANRLTHLDERWDEEIEAISQEAVQFLDTHDVLIMTTNSPHQDQLNLTTIANEFETTEEHLAKRIAAGIGMVTMKVLQSTNYSVGGCFSSGGDITSSICTISNAEGIKLEEEVLPLVAYGKLMGGELDGLPIITKGGMAGEKDALYKSIKFLTNHC